MEPIRLTAEQYNAVITAVFKLVDAVEEHQRAINFEDEGSAWEKKCDDEVDACLNRIRALLKGEQLVYVIDNNEMHEGTLGRLLRSGDRVVTYEENGNVHCVSSPEYYDTELQASIALQERQKHDRDDY